MTTTQAAGDPPRQNAPVATEPRPPQEQIPQKAPALDRDQQVAFSRRGIELNSLADVQRVAQWIVASKWNPKNMGVADCAVAIMRGIGLGMGPVQAVECIAVINGRATVWGDMMLALCQASGRFDQDAFLEWFDNDDNVRKLAPDPKAGKPDRTRDDYTAHCVAKRIGAKMSKAYAYSIGDAKRAGLWKKPGTWTTNPDRMQIYRGRAFCLRDAFSDVLQGLYDRDEMLDADMVLDQIDLGNESQPNAVPIGTKTEQLAEQLAPTAPLEPVPAAPVDSTDPSCASGPSEAPEAVLEPEPAGDTPVEPSAPCGKPLTVDLESLRGDIRGRLMALRPEAHAAIRKAYGAKDVAGMKAVVASMDDPKDLNDLKLAIVDAAGKAKTAKGT